MSNVEKISIALPREMISGIKSAVESGEYATTSEVVRDAMRDWKHKRQRASLEIDELRRMVNEGVASGPSIDAGTVFARLRAKYGAMDQGVE